MKELYDCIYRTDEEGNLVEHKAKQKVVEDLYQIKKLASKVVTERSYWFDSLIFSLETNLVKNPKPNWLVENRDELMNTVYLISDLEVLSTDDEHEKKSKLLLSTKLIEFINS